MNIIRTGNTVFRTNYKILYKQTVTPQCLLCSHSGSGDDKRKKDSNKDDNRKNKTEIKKPVDVNTTKYMKLNRSRHDEGKKTILKLIQNITPNVKKGSLKDKSGHDESQYLNRQLLDVDKTIGNSDEFKKEPIKVPLASKPVSQKKSRANLMTLIQDAAVELGGKPENTKKELLQAYMSVKYMPYAATSKKESLEDDAQRGSKLDPRSSNVLSDNKKLNIFTKKVDHEKAMKPELKMWQKLYADHLDNLGMNPPRNYFEQLIHWTKQGKLWHFPIDNEQGMELEQNTSFTEHIFLEKHLDPWCPQAGPLRHFMELVTVGLSKNPYLSVEQKKEHIMWYRDYFEKKRKLLEEVGVLESKSTSHIESS